MSRGGGSEMLPRTAETALRIDALCDEYEKSLQAGGAERLENILDSAQAPERAELLHQLLLLEWEYKSGRGESIVPVVELTRFPRDSETVRKAFAEFARSSNEQDLPERISGMTAASESGRQAWRNKGFEILGRLGRGGMSAVYLAYEPARNRLAALKTLPPGMDDSPNGLARFRREVETLSRCHDQSVRLWPFLGRLDGTPAQLRLWCEFITGMELNAEQASRVLDNATWTSRRKALENFRKARY